MVTILIWLGSGFAFSVGVVVGARIMLMPGKAAQAAMDANEKSIAALLERNKIGSEQLSALERIASSLEEIALRR